MPGQQCSPSQAAQTQYIGLRISARVVADSVTQPCKHHVRPHAHNRALARSQHPLASTSCKKYKHRLNNHNNALLAGPCLQHYCCMWLSPAKPHAFLASCSTCSSSLRTLRCSLSTDTQPASKACRTRLVRYSRASAAVACNSCWC